MSVEGVQRMDAPKEEREKSLVDQSTTVDKAGEKGLIPGKGEEAGLVRVVGCVEAHYDVQEVEFGRVYRWCPEGVVVECECGEKPTLTSSITTCGECCADYTATVREKLAARRLGDESLHPWRYAGDREHVVLPY